MAQSNDSFNSMGLKVELIRGLAARGFDRPSALQQLALPPILRGFDTVVQTPSGNDRTSTFSVGILQKLDPNLQACQAIILEGKYEHVGQTRTFMTDAGCSSQVQFGIFYAGTSKREMIKACQDGAQVIIGSPFLVNDMIHQTYLKIDQVKTVVLDHATDDVYPESIDGIYRILSAVPPTAQIIVLSSTPSRLTLGIAARFMKDPARASTNQNTVDPQALKQYKITCQNDEDKAECLPDLLHVGARAAIFCNTREKADFITSYLSKMDMDATALYADTPEAARTKIASDFESGSGGTLVTSDPKAKGVDLQDVSLSIGFELPVDAKDYVYRLGWRGAAVNFLTAADADKVKEIEKLYTIKIEEMPLNVADFV